MNTGCTDLISVIMPCFNSEKYLHEAIESVLEQTYDNIELIVVDDGSTDNSVEIARGYGDRVLLITQNNKGPYPARNKGLEVSNGTFVAFLDADDYWRADFVEKLYSTLCNSNAVLAYCGWQNIGLKGGSGEPFIPPDYESGNKAELFLRHAAPWPIHAALIKRSALDEVGGFNEKLFSCMDYDLWLRIGTSRHIERVNETLAFYRHHSEEQITSKKWEQARNVWLIKQSFIKKNPDLVSDIIPSTLKELVDGELLHRAYETYWRRDLVSARKIFRMVLWTGSWGFKDVKYIIPSLLPEYLYTKIIKKIDIH